MPNQILQPYSINKPGDEGPQFDYNDYTLVNIHQHASTPMQLIESIFDSEPGHL